MGKAPSHQRIEKEPQLAPSVEPAFPIEPQEPFATPTTKIVAGRYSILEKIGAGGMSTVYKAQHVHLNKVFAVKILHKTQEESSILRFQQEAKASSLLEHPNIVRVHDFGISDKVPYMAMDYVQGSPLSEIVKREGPMSCARVTRLFGQICGALAHAHEQGVVHRDIKPSNIMIKGDGQDSEQAIVVDFGIAKIMTKAETVSIENLTRTGDIFGTPLYMSPEQGQGNRSDARTDIYALGCVMYEALTGNPPFQGENVYQIIHKQITEAPPPFPERLRKTQQGRQLEALVLKAMAKVPGDRHKYMLELSSELKSIELSTGSWWTDLGVLAKILNARLKAAEKRTILTNWSLRICTMFAIVLTVAVVALPPSIRTTTREVQRLTKILDWANNLFDKGYKSESPFWASKAFGTTMKELEQLCQNDKRQRANFEALAKDAHKARRTSIGMTKAIQSNMSITGLGMEGILEAYKSINLTVSQWIEVRKREADLLNLTTEKLEQEKQRLQLLQTLLLSCRLFAIPVGLLLLLGLLSNLKHRHQDTQATESGNWGQRQSLDHI